MITQLRAVFITQYSFKTFIHIHIIELVGLVWLVVVFYGATFIYSLLEWP